MKLPNDFLGCVSLVFKDEGGYVNDPSDRGGETKFGISKRAYPDENIKELTYERARELYKRDYWDTAHCDQVPDEIKYIHFDSAINMGVRMAVKLLQRSGGIVDDGMWGKDTLAASKNVTLDRYASERILQYEDLVKQRPMNEKFIKGWKNRVNRIITLSKEV